MPYSGNPADSVLDRVRLTVGDTLPQPVLDDDTYEYLVSKHNGNESKVAIEAARMILFNLARFTRERAGDIEVYGADYFRNYRQALQDWLDDPNSNPIYNNAMPYAGGISVSDMKKNNDNSDNVKKEVYKGFSENDSDVRDTNDSFEW